MHMARSRVRDTGAVRRFAALRVAEFAGLGLNVEYVSAELVTTPPTPVTDALCGATRSTS